jgi:hypothetical protein
MKDMLVTVVIQLMIVSGSKTWICDGHLCLSSGLS